MPILNIYGTRFMMRSIILNFFGMRYMGGECHQSVIREGRGHKDSPLQLYILSPIYILPLTYTHSLSLLIHFTFISILLLHLHIYVLLSYLYSQYLLLHLCALRFHNSYSSFSSFFTLISITFVHIRGTLITTNKKPTSFTTSGSNITSNEKTNTFLNYI